MIHVLESSSLGNGTVNHSTRQKFVLANLFIVSLIAHCKLNFPKTFKFTSLLYCRGLTLSAFSEGIGFVKII